MFLPKGKYGLRYKCSYGSENIINNISVYKSTKCNIKTVLVKNQPGRAIMRKLPNGTKDIVKKHNNNKYYFHKKCGQIVFDGSSDEVWVQHDEINVGNSHMRFSIIIPDIVKQDFNTNILCNAFPTGDTNTTSNDERILTSLNRSFHLKIAKSKLTSHDITGLKTWLASNPITVIYELDMEQVYECVNLDLDSYGIDSFVLCDSKVKISNLSYKRINNINDTIETIKNRITSSETEIMEMLNSQKINSIGHKTLPGGLLLQWGITDIDFNNSSLMTKEVNYPVMFPNDILFQSANVYTPDSRTYGYSVNMCFLSYEKGAIRANRISGTTASEKIHVCWMALGY